MAFLSVALSNTSQSNGGYWTMLRLIDFVDEAKYTWVMHFDKEEWI